MGSRGKGEREKREECWGLPRGSLGGFRNPDIEFRFN